MYEVAYLLRRLAVEAGCTVVVTNDMLPVWSASRRLMGSSRGGHSSSGGDRGRREGDRRNSAAARFKPALGMHWAAVAHLRLELHGRSQQCAVGTGAHASSTAGPEGETPRFEAVTVLRSSFTVRSTVLFYLLMRALLRLELH